MGSSRQKTINRPSKSSDVYSFGMIFYELITGNTKYRNLSTTEIKAKFRHDNNRPKIPNNIK